MLFGLREYEVRSNPSNKNNVSMLFGLREYEVRSNPSNKKY